MRMPSPIHAKKLSGLAKQHQANAMAKIHVARSTGPMSNNQVAKLATVNPQLAHAARQMASQRPARVVHDSPGYNDALSSAHKAMHMATAFHKASKGLAQPMGKRARKALY